MADVITNSKGKRCLLVDWEVATVIEALTYYRDALRAEGKTGNTAQSALDGINGIMAPNVRGLIITPDTGA